MGRGTEEQVEFGILGPFRLVGSDGAERRATARQRDLLALLALHAGAALTQAQLIDALWGEQLPANPTNALQQRVFHARRLLGDDGDALQTGPAGYRLAIEADQVDVARFERSRAAGHDALVTDDPARATVLLREALDHWRGEPLQDVGAPWAAPAAQRLAEERLRAVEDLMAANLALGQHAQVIEALEELTAEHPLRERFRGQLMRALAMSGRQADALAVYTETRRRLAEELGLDPSPELQRVHADVLAQRTVPPSVGGVRGAEPASGEEGAVPPGSPEDAGGPARPRRTRLPSSASSFVGREPELERLTALLATHRIVTVTGPGGAGKTRLVIEALQRLHAGAADASDVVFVPLASVADPAAVPASVATALELGGQTDLPVTEVLAAALETRPTRLVLDSCEHLIDAVSDLAAYLVASCPPLRILTTSREPLGVAGEVVWPLDPLPVPDADTVRPDVARGSPAVELFLDRIAAVVPDRTPGDEDIATIVRIVRELDGLPLAIELAATRARAMSLEEIADRLSARFALLAGGRRDSPARHRALSAAVEWSWDLLDEDGRAAWMAAAVPAQAFDLELLGRLLAAVAPDLDPVDAVTDLCDRSILRVESRGNPTRYEMLSTLREFGQQRLAESEREDAVRTAHAETIEARLAAADRTDLHVWDVDLDALRACLPEVRGAMRWRATQGDRRGMQRLAAGLGWLALLTALTGEGRRLVDLAVGPLEEIDPSDVEPRAVLWAAGLRLGDVQSDGTAWARLAVEVAEDTVTRHLAQGFLTAYLALEGDIAAGLDLIAREAAVGGWLEGLWRLLEGKLLTFVGRIDEAEQAVRRAGRSLSEGSTVSSMFVGDIAVHLATLRGDLAGVREAAHRGISECRRQRAAELEIELRCLLAMAEAAEGNHAEAAAEFEEVQAIHDRAGPAMSAALIAVADGYRLWRGGDLAGAERAWEAALDLHHWTGLVYGRPFALWGLGHLALAGGAPDHAEDCFGRSLSDALDRGDLDATATSLEGLAALALVRDDPERAARLLGAAAARREAIGATAPLLTRGDAEAAREEARARIGEAAFTTESRTGAGLEDLSDLLGP